ncbi:transposase [Streptococcus sp. 714]|uniref:transposase n=1 Tax=Streptococcus sp. 714 TaxID=2582653 RepID=UPI0023DB277A|nr:transposase [Streptococcus sp. 714]
MALIIGLFIFILKNRLHRKVFGQIKACLGYKRYKLRGKRQVRIDMGLVLMANNLLKYNKRTTKN